MRSGLAFALGFALVLPAPAHADVRVTMKDGLVTVTATNATVREILERFSDREKEVENLIRVMIRDGILVRISEDLNFHGDALERLREDYRRILVRDGQATPASFKELTGLSRKFIIPLMEYFDMTKLTMRAGDHRILRERPEK